MGRCRAWIRLAVNECALENYIGVLCQDDSLLKYVHNLCVQFLSANNVLHVRKMYDRLVSWFNLKCCLCLLDRQNWKA